MTLPEPYTLDDMTGFRATATHQLREHRDELRTQRLRLIYSAWEAGVCRLSDEPSRIARALKMWLDAQGIPYIETGFMDIQQVTKMLDAWLEVNGPVAPGEPTRRTNENPTDTL